MTGALEVRLARLILSGAEFSSNELTADGAITLDAGHRPNARQNGIGSLFNSAARRNLIAFTGKITKSSAPHRKHGMVRVWRGTDAGRLWARSVLDAVGRP